MAAPICSARRPVLQTRYAPVVTRFLSYDIPLDKACSAYCKRMMDLPAMQEWVNAAKAEPDEIDELDAEF